MLRSRPYAAPLVQAYNKLLPATLLRPHHIPPKANGTLLHPRDSAMLLAPRQAALPPNPSEVSSSQAAETSKLRLEG